MHAECNCARLNQPCRAGLMKRQSAGRFEQISEALQGCGKASVTRSCDPRQLAA